MTNETIQTLRERFLSGSYSPEDALLHTKSVIEAKDKEVHAFLHQFTGADQSAKAAALALKDQGKEAGVLTGVPIAIKANIMVEGEVVNAASKALKDYIAPYNATIIDRLIQAGAVLVGSTNMDEFAMGGSTENSAFGPTKNPHDLSRVPGGSSGGSAAAVAMGAVPAAIGTDTGGSIRQPASFCGLVGFKPTYGAVSRYGLIAMGSSLDQAGPLTHTVADAELIHTVIAGHDPMDMTTFKAGTYPTVEVKDTYTIGVPRSFLKEGVDADVLAAFDAHIASLKALGHTVVDIEMPRFEQGLAAYYIVMPAEVSSNLARYDGIRYGERIDGEDLLAVYKKSRAKGLGAEVKRRILLGTYVLSSGYFDAYYAKAETVRQLMRDELAELFQSVDAIITPTAPTPAFAFGATEDPLSLYKQDIFTVPVNLAGVPALSFPMGVVTRGETELTVGVQYIGPHAGDARLFDIGKRVYDQRV